MSSRQATAPLDNSTGGPYTIETISTEQALSALESDWNRLSESAEHPNVFMTYDWFRAWLNRGVKESRHGCFQPNVLVLKNANEVVGISPLIRRLSARFFRVRKLGFVTNHSDYNDLTLGPDSIGMVASVADFLAQTTEQWDVVELRDLRDTGTGTASLDQALSRVGLPHSIFPEPDRCPYLPITGDAASCMNGLSGHVRRTLRKRMERAEAEGLRTRIIENPHQETGLLDTLVGLDWQKHLHRLSPTFVGTYPEVFESLFHTLGPLGWLYVALLEQGDHPVAFQIGFRCGTKLWDYSKAYDRSFSKFAPGILLTLSLLDYGFAHGFDEYDFLRGEETYKTLWSSGYHGQFRVLIWNRRWLSRTRKWLYSDLRSTLYRMLGRPLR